MSQNAHSSLSLPTELRQRILFLKLTFRDPHAMFTKPLHVVVAIVGYCFICYLCYMSGVPRSNANHSANTPSAAVHIRSGPSADWGFRCFIARMAGAVHEPRIPSWGTRESRESSWLCEIRPALSSRKPTGAIKDDLTYVVPQHLRNRISSPRGCRFDCDTATAVVKQGT